MFYMSCAGNENDLFSTFQTVKIFYDNKIFKILGQQFQNHVAKNGR